MTDREFLRHAVATVAYRASKSLRDAPEAFADFRAGPASRSAVEILAHLGDLFAWARSMSLGDPKWSGVPARSWTEERDRFFAALRAFDDVLASSDPVHYDLTRLFQGPVADALTHVGQIALLRGLHGAPVKGESYNRADVVAGRVGMEQTPADPRYEF
jgi:hypothetical protein